VFEDGVAIKQDMALDRTGNYLYAMTDTKVNSRHVGAYNHHRHHHRYICCAPITNSSNNSNSALRAKRGDLQVLV